MRRKLKLPREATSTGCQLTASPAPSGLRSPRWRWEAACAGELPAEALSTRDREDLVWHLHELGWTDVQIAEHTRMSTYTAARIRDCLGLAPHQPKEAAA
ncbi:hypothetical protein [Amycolatopsis taiwanensis]|uniref:hypothetical protein n=1 Tax=Amycolatopsis taiwanensis TaxID=342230 RepID=UPI000488E9BD|nr:hypothetical protein [Amycolatopsis taiwanensis]